MKVLIVGGEKDSRIFLERQLLKEGFEVFAAANGAEALESTRNSPPDIVISDIMMPEMDGYELCRRIKKDPHLGAIPFIFYTATLIDPKDEQLAMALGGDRFIVKPIEIGRLLEIIKEVLDAYEQQTLPAKASPTKSDVELTLMYEESISRKLDKQVRELEERQQALVQSERKYRRLVEGLKDEYFFYSHNKEGLFTYVSPSVTTVLGYTPKQFLTYYAQYHTDNPINKDAAHFTELSLKGSVQPKYEVEVYHTDGSRRTLEVKETPVFDSNGNVRSIEGVAHDITERKQVDQRLKANERFLNAIVENIPNMIFVKDAENLRFVRHNKAGEDLLGYTRDELIGKSDYDFFPEEQAEFFTRKDREVLGKGLLVDIAEETIQTQSKGTRILHTRKIPMMNEKGQPEYLLGISEDITDRKQGEAALRQSEKKFRNLFNSAPDAILTMRGSDILIKDFNQKSLETFKCTPEDLQGKTPYDLSPSRQHDGRDSKEKALEIIGTLLDMQQPSIFDWQHQRFDGDVFDAEVSLSILEYEPEVIFQAIIRDVSKRKQLDRQVRLMQHWVEHSVDLFFWVREDSRVQYVNQAVCDFLGYTRQEICAMRVSDFDLKLPPEAWPEFARTLKRLGSYYFESQLQKKDGSISPVEITANILRYEDKDYFFAYGRDISDRIKAKKERENLEKQLMHGQKMEAIGTLAGGIAHDFNNILSAIIGYTELSKFDLSPESEISKNLNHVIKAGGRAKELVQQILTFSRQTEHMLKPVQTKLIVKEALKLLRASLPATIDIAQNIESNSMVLGDPTQIHQIIMNLCTNAAYAMRASGGTLAVSLTNVQPEEGKAKQQEDLRPGNYIELSVQDRGEGMTPELLQRIYEPFFTTKERDKGTGMGLAVVHGIVRSYGGHINVMSEPGVGTTFKVLLPVIDIESELPAEPTEALPLGHERILLIDDEPDIVKISERVLGDLGYQVVSRTSSLEALQMFIADKHRFDLVITDLTMPQMTGDKLAEELLKIREDTPIILCTGFSYEITEKMTREKGIRALLMKPILRKELAITVRKVLDEEKGSI